MNWNSSADKTMLCGFHSFSFINILLCFLFIIKWCKEIELWREHWTILCKVQVLHWQHGKILKWIKLEEINNSFSAKVFIFSSCIQTSSNGVENHVNSFFFSVMQVSAEIAYIYTFTFELCDNLFSLFSLCHGHGSEF